MDFQGQEALFSLPDPAPESETCGFPERQVGKKTQMPPKIVCSSNLKDESSFCADPRLFKPPTQPTQRNEILLRQITKAQTVRIPSKPSAATSTRLKPKKTWYFLQNHRLCLPGSPRSRRCFYSPSPSTQWRELPHFIAAGERIAVQTNSRFVFLLGKCENS